MANGLFDAARKAFLDADIDWVNDAVSCYLISASYTVNLSAHANLQDVAGGARVSGPVALTGKASTGGAADADNVTHPAVVGSAVVGILLCKNTGNEATSTLIAWIDTATGLPITPNGGDIIISWDNGTNKIFRL